MDSSPRILAVHYYRKILPSVNNPPNWLVCPYIHVNPVFKHLIHSLYLIISLRMVGSDEVQLGTQICKQTLPKIGSKLGIPIRDYCLRKSMQSEISFMKFFGMASTLYVDLTNIKCDAFVKFSTTTMMESCCLQVIGNLVINP